MRDFCEVCDADCHEDDLRDGMCDGCRSDFDDADLEDRLEMALDRGFDERLAMYRRAAS